MSKEAQSEKAYISDLKTEFEEEGLPQNEINKVLKIAEENLQCDRECQREKKLTEYKKNWIDSKDLFLHLPNTILKNEKKYYVLDKGEFYYRNNVQKKKYTDQINSYKDTQLERLAKFKDDTDTLLGNYKSVVLYKSRINELYTDRKNINKQLKTEVVTSKKQITTDARRIYYKDQNIDNLSYYKNVLYIMYYIIPPLLFIIYLATSTFISNQEYKDFKNVIIILIILALYICLAIPMVLKLLAEKTIAAWKFFGNINI